MNHIHTIMKELQHLKYSGRLTVAIDGLGRAGKTTLSRLLENTLTAAKIPFQIFHIDDHIVQRKERYDTGYPEWHEYYYLQWKVKWLEEHFFSQLKHNPVLQLPYYELSTDTITEKSVVLPPQGIIIVEGVFLQREQWRSYFDYVIYLESDQQTRYYRENKEMQAKLRKLQERYWKAEDYYVKKICPAEKADLLLRN